MKEKNQYKTIVISDVHLGTESSKVKELISFLKENTCDKLILNGDIIGGTRLFLHLWLPVKPIKLSLLMLRIYPEIQNCPLLAGKFKVR